VIQINVFQVEAHISNTPSLTYTAADMRCNLIFRAANQREPNGESSRIFIHSDSDWRCPMLQIDPWAKAAECERAIRMIADPERRSVLISLRRLWISLGTEGSVSDSSRQAGQAPKIAQIHAELLFSYRRAMN
jgi:hypothetical protein